MQNLTHLAVALQTLLTFIALKVAVQIGFADFTFFILYKSCIIEKS